MHRCMNWVLSVTRKVQTMQGRFKTTNSAGLFLIGSLMLLSTKFCTVGTSMALDNSYHERTIGRV